MLIGAIMLLAGVLLRAYGGGVEIPVFSLPAVGLVLIVLGALEMVLSLAALVGARKPSGSGR